MMTMLKKLLTVLAVLTVSVTAHAADSDSLDADSLDVRQPAAGRTVRPVLSAFGVEGGSAHAADTYLSPLHYSGWHVGLTYERMQAMRFNPDNWVMQLNIAAETDRMHNPAMNAWMWNFELDARWTMMRRWRTVAGIDGLTLAVGPNAELRGGALYLPRNGNNPAAAKGAVTIGATGMAAYNMTVGRLPVTLRYQCAMPATGVFFAPQYGELYYQIWLGDHDGLARAAWPGNYFRMDNTVTADLRLGGTTLRVGYHNITMSTKASHIVSNRTTHAFTLAVVTEWTSLSSRRRPDSDARVISALY